MKKTDVTVGETYAVYVGYGRPRGAPDLSPERIKKGEVPYNWLRAKVLDLNGSQEVEVYDRWAPDGKKKVMRHGVVIEGVDKDGKKSKRVLDNCRPIYATWKDFLTEGANQHSWSLERQKYEQDAKARGKAQVARLESLGLVEGYGEDFTVQSYRDHGWPDLTRRGVARLLAAVEGAGLTLPLLPEDQD